MLCMPALHVGEWLNVKLSLYRAGQTFGTPEG